VATAEKVWRDHRADAAFDFSPVVVNLAKAYEVQLGLVFGQIARALPPGAGRTNVDGRTADAFEDGRVPGLGLLARVLGEDRALRSALPRVLEHWRWVAESLPAILDDLAAVRNRAAHREEVRREDRPRNAQQQLGVGMPSGARGAGASGSAMTAVNEPWESWDAVPAARGRTGVPDHAESHGPTNFCSRCGTRTATRASPASSWTGSDTVARPSRSRTA
jgi:hypothetical protein